MYFASHYKGPLLSGQPSTHTFRDQTKPWRRKSPAWKSNAWCRPLADTRLRAAILFQA